MAKQPSIPPTTVTPFKAPPEFQTAPKSPMCRAVVEIELLLEDCRHVATEFNLHLSPKQADTLMRVFRSLNEAHAQLKNGHHVDGMNDTVRWRLEQIESSAPCVPAAP